MKISNSLILIAIIISAVLVMLTFTSFIEISILRQTAESQKVQIVKYKEESITFEQLNKDMESKIISYIRSNYKRIPSPTVDLIAKNTVKFAQEFGLPVSIIIGMIEVESSFNPSQVSSAKARGLMQVRWSVWKELLTDDNMTNEFDLHEIDKGIMAGIIVLRHYISKNDGNMSKALYDYVGKNKDYPTKVYNSMGRFMLYERGEEKEKETDKS